MGAQRQIHLVTQLAAHVAARGGAHNLLQGDDPGPLRGDCGRRDFQPSIQMTEGGEVGKEIECDKRSNSRSDGS